MTKTYKISEISNMTRLSIPTLRYYEKLGLLNPKRSSNNYRIFTDKDLGWIEFINRAKATGMPLSKIIEYSSLREQGNETIKERIDILEQQERILYAEQQKIQAHIDFLQNKKQHYAKLIAKYKNHK
ncbi:MerR family transcriptional regulator [Liquorilactobacillus uvarum]|uniref:Transcription regulator n=1 Tax=Liquorilactobacillus uvarum DSM 19971 TaxID=1423812 RepID=A0A0R1PPQ8_9LACO|nr:MerR family transcriptional regulator [Liquorilactobacillus uvarum]KRL34534.1 transcription regulator [Liquorilactobacillus uvarum DSM 19971]